MKGITLDQFKEITEFVQAHHSFARYGGKDKRLEAGITPEVAEYGFGIKYVRCDYDTREGDVWGITFDSVRFSTNHWNALNPPPKQWKYDNLYDLSMAYLKGEFKPKEEFYIKNNGTV